MKIYTRRQLMMEEARVKPYISDGLVFHLDGADATDTTWVDRIGGVVFNMSNVVCDGKGVYFKGVSTSRGHTSTNVNYDYRTSTIEVVIHKRQQSGFVFVTEGRSPVGICYIQGNGSVNFTHGEAGKRVNVITQNVNKIVTHSINMDRSILNGKLTGFMVNDSWGYQGSGTFLGTRGNLAYPLNGDVYQIRIYNRKLSEAEILFNQEQDRKRYGIQF